MGQSVDTVPRPREEDDIYGMVSRAQGGDLLARDHLIRAYTPFIMRTASSSARRYVTVGRDDEASIALLAFNEAISGFSSEKSRSFFAFAETVIRRRLIDYFRRNEARAREIPFSSLMTEDEDGELTCSSVSRAEFTKACTEVVARDEAWERREEILQYKGLLSDYGIRFDDLVADCPKHADARDRAMEVARLVSATPELLLHLQTRKELPLKALGGLVSVSRKTLERQRRYIIALCIIIVEDLRFLREYVK